MTTLVYPPVQVVTLMRRLMGANDAALCAFRRFPQEWHYELVWLKREKDNERLVATSPDEGVVAKAVKLGLLKTEREYTDEYGWEWKYFIPTDKAHALSGAKWVVGVLEEPPTLFPLPEVVRKARMD